MQKKSENRADHKQLDPTTGKRLKDSLVMLNVSTVERNMNAVLISYLETRRADCKITQLIP